MTSLAPLTLVLGGARSGKSRHAEALLTSHPPPWRYVATAQALDAEMAERIAMHRARRDKGWEIHEVPLALPECIARLAIQPAPILVDCLTLWLSNLMLGELDVSAACEKLEAALDAAMAPIVLVANEVGLGIVPQNALARRFRDEAGRLNQRLAVRATRVFFVVAGLPMQVK
ncbi:MAG: bifunctional adenosylcobinamide kinase/adenosylcobinamide-phosphate guanylyltransferase [Hyphomicrobiales bacterium]|nr:bifunctional adenosylcobinamide kinase/adenosylcobinamide-phosphate guanylyltransferase [Hyphomicrobiales bacterium]